MGLYSYQHSDGRIIDIYQSMQGNHDVWIDEDGNEWKRVYNNVPHAVVDGLLTIDPRSPQEFVRKTAKSKGKLGDLYEIAAELSDKRKAKDGIDGVERKSWSKYEKSRPNTIHPGRKKQLLKEAVGKSKHFELE
ncbi:MAG: hypothetical protein AABY07_08050 [Nanoarchaeota archaeon]